MHSRHRRAACASARDRPHAPRACARTSELVGQIIRTHDGHFGGEQKAMYAAPISTVSLGFQGTNPCGALLDSPALTEIAFAQPIQDLLAYTQLAGAEFLEEMQPYKVERPGSRAFETAWVRSCIGSRAACATAGQAEKASRAPTRAVRMACTPRKLHTHARAQGSTAHPFRRRARRPGMRLLSNLLSCSSSCSPRIFPAQRHC